MLLTSFLKIIYSSIMSNHIKSLLCWTIMEQYTGERGHKCWTPEKYFHAPFTIHVIDVYHAITSILIKSQDYPAAYNHS